ncbi:putative membrane protein [Rhodopirellula maiorica SM1]|uniref:Putative membrane protein n=1 Tax=Rhodopirellula maiorica SM1 TaxID=1265738 RepID=M5S112_9BACT|nr:O-antigen ligase family protein [Rhodopirellula maiorica]EMI19854.1 putative membrane protein [Rhodopirellula maiorica SM1]
MFHFIALSVAVLMLFVARFYSPRHAARVGWGIAFLVPTWLALSVGAADVTVRCVVALMAVAVVVVKPRQFVFAGFSWIDLLPVVIVMTAAISTTLNDHFSPTVILSLLAQWMFPYMLARLILVQDQDAIDFVPLAATVALLLAGAMIFESVADYNLFNTLLGHEGSSQGDSGHRLGLKRAEAWFGHPIYAGLVLALASPWVFTQAYQSFWGRGSKFWLVGPVILAMGTVATLSRGPCMVLGGVILGLVWYYFPPIRLFSLFACVLVIATSIVMLPTILKMADSIENQDGIREIKIEDETYTYSGTRHRYLLFTVYKKPLSQVGWIGYGNWGTLPQHEAMLEPHLRGLFLSVDNHYLLHYLNTGVVGSIAFLLLPIGVFMAFLRQHTMLTQPTEFLTVALLSSVMATTVVIITVWMAEPYSFAFLFNAGCIVGLLVSARRSTPMVARKARRLQTVRPQPASTTNQDTSF